MSDPPKTEKSEHKYQAKKQLLSSMYPHTPEKEQDYEKQQSSNRWYNSTLENIGKLKEHEQNGCTSIVLFNSTNCHLAMRYETSQLIVDKQPLTSEHIALGTCIEHFHIPMISNIVCPNIGAALAAKRIGQGYPKKKKKNVLVHGMDMGTGHPTTYGT